MSDTSDEKNVEMKEQKPGCRGFVRKHLRWIIPAAVIVLLAAGWFGAAFAVESIVRKCLADAGRGLVGQEVKPDSVSCSLIKQELCIKGIRVQNPPGYTQPYVFEAKLILVRVKPLFFLFKRVVHLQELRISGIRINAEQKKVQQGGFPEINLLELKKAGSVARRSAKQAVRSTPRTASKSGSVSNRSTVQEKKAKKRRQKESLRFCIDELRVEKAEVSLYNFASPRSSFTLKSYVQKDLGRGNDGLTAGELAEEIFKRHLKDIFGRPMGRPGKKTKKENGTANIFKIWGKGKKQDPEAQSVSSGSEEPKKSPATE